MTEEEEFEIPIPSDYRILVQKLCMHELGHYVAGRELGADPTDITIKFSGWGKFYGNSSMSVVRSLVTTDEIRNYLEDRICILMAGTLGEHLSVDPNSKHVYDKDRWKHQAVDAFEQESSSASDKDKGGELLRLLLFMEGVEGSPDKEELQTRLSAITQRIWSKAIDIVSNLAWEFYLVSGMMTDRIRLLGATVIMTSEEIEAYFEKARNKADANS